VHKVLVGKAEGKKPLGRRRRKWEEGIRMDVLETCWGGVWIRLAQDRERWWAVVNAVMNFRVLAPRIKLSSTGEFHVTNTSSRIATWTCE
jgi:hypothetical protein